MSKLPALADAQNPVAFFLHGIGDALFALPALRALAGLFEGRLKLVCERSLYRLFFHELPLREVIEADVLPNQSLGRVKACDCAFNVDNLARKIGDCDIFLSLVPWRSQHLDNLVSLLAPRFSIGLADGFDVSLERRSNQHTFDQTFAIPRLFAPSLEVDKFASPPLFRATAWKHAARIVQILPSDSRILAIHNESSAQKTWPVDRLQLTLRAFLNGHPEFWALTLGVHKSIPEDACSELKIAPCEGLALDTSMCILAFAHIFLGVDSCMLHAADLWRIPSVALIGPTRSCEFGCRFAPHCHVDGQGTMAGVPVAEVLYRLETLVPTYA
jgi:hypothetical protein